MGAHESWSDFLLMGSHGPFVWSVYAIAVLALAGQLAGIRRMRRRVVHRVARWHRLPGRDDQ